MLVYSLSSIKYDDGEASENCLDLRRVPINQLIDGHEKLIEMSSTNARKCWFVLRDFKKSNAKTPAYKELPKFGVRCFTPMHWVVRALGVGRKQKVYVPVIQNLLFAYGSREELDPIIERTEKLQYQFKRGGAPGTLMTVPDEEMDRFIKAVSQDETTLYYTPEEISADMLGRDIEVIGGLLDGYRGKLLKVQGSKFRRLIVEIKGCMAAAVKVEPSLIKFVDD